MADISVVSAADGSAWEARWMAEIPGANRGVRIVRRCVDVVDLLAVAAAGHGQVALVSSRLRRLDADALDRLEASGVVPVAVLEADDSAGAARVHDLGIRHVVAEDAAAEVAATIIATALIESGEARVGDTSRSFAQRSSPVAVPPVAGSAQPPDRLEGHDRHGAVIAVWGPTGGPGRTTVALNLADEVAALGAQSLLVDADVYGGMAAAMLGLLDESPGIVAAARQAGSGRLDVAALAALCWQVSPMMRVLTGLPRTDRWPELRPAAIAPVLGAARALADFTFVDVGFSLETDEELSFDTLAPRRNGATLAVLDEADVILAVGAGDIAGMHRLVRALSDLRDADISAPVWIVLNKVRGSAAHARAGTQLTDALRRFAGQPPAAMLPSDAAAWDGAALAGQPLRLVSPRSPLRLALAELAAAVAGRESATIPGGRRHGSSRARSASRRRAAGASRASRRSAGR